MRKTLIATLAAIPLVAVGAYAFAAQSTPSGDDILAATPAQSSPAGKAVVGKRLSIKGLAIESERGELGEVEDGMEDGE